MEFLDIIAAFCCAALSGLGIGGGGLLIIYLTLIKNISQIEARGVNLVFFVLCMSISLIIHLKKGRIYKKILPIAMPFCILGGILGSIAAIYIDTELLRLIFGWFLVISGIISLLKNASSRHNRKNRGGGT